MSTGAAIPWQSSNCSLVVPSWLILDACNVVDFVADGILLEILLDPAWLQIHASIIDTFCRFYYVS